MQLPEAQAVPSKAGSAIGTLKSYEQSDRRAMSNLHRLGPSPVGASPVGATPVGVTPIGAYNGPATGRVLDSEHQDFEATLLPDVGQA